MPVLENRVRFTDNVYYNYSGDGGTAGYKSKKMSQQTTTNEEFRGEILSTSDLIIGDVVYINGEGDWRGKICFLGEVHFSKGEWAGVALDHPMGNHDGQVKSRRYFQCPQGHGVFVRVGRLSKKKLVPETLDAEKLGLYRENPKYSDVYWREGSPILSRSGSVTGSGGGMSPRASPRASVEREFSFPSMNGNSVEQRRENWRESSPMDQMSDYYNSERVRKSQTRSRSGSPGLASGKMPKIGERVIVASSIGDAKAGVLRFLGEVDFAEGQWAGIELSYPQGKNDGTVRGKEYFRCKHPFGLFVPSNKIETSPANKTLGKRMGTRDNLFAVVDYQQGNNRGVRAGSYDDYF